MISMKIAQTFAPLWRPLGCCSNLNLKIYTKNFIIIGVKNGHYTIIDFCSGGHEVLLNSKLHIDRRETEIIMICFLLNNKTCSPQQKPTIVLLYKK